MRSCGKTMVYPSGQDKACPNTSLDRIGIVGLQLPLQKNSATRDKLSGWFLNQYIALLRDLLEPKDTISVDGTLTDLSNLIQTRLLYTTLWNRAKLSALRGYLRYSYPGGVTTVLNLSETRSRSRIMSLNI